MKDGGRLLLFVIFLMLSSSINAQFTTPKSKLELDFNKSDTLHIKHNPSKVILQKTVKRLPLFCGIEDKMEKNAKIPVRFRLGNLNYVNKLEGKN